MLPVPVSSGFCQQESPFHVEAKRLEDEWSKIAPSFEDTLRQQEVRKKNKTEPTLYNE